MKIIKVSPREAYKRRQTEITNIKTYLDETTRKYVNLQSTATLYNYFKELKPEYLPNQGPLREFCQMVFILCGEYLQKECPQAMNINELPKRQRETFKTPLKPITLEEIDQFFQRQEKNT